MPPIVHSIASQDVTTSINLLINHLITDKDETGKFLLHLEDGRIIDTKGWAGWEWTHGIGLYGLWKYYALTNTPSTLQIIEDWFAARFAEGGTTKNINTMAPFLTLAFVYEKTRNPSYLPWLESWADWAMYELPRTKFGGMSHQTYNSTNAQELWDDTLMMTVLPLAKIGLVLHKPEYVEEAKRQFLIHIHYLSDRRTGLWFHGWTFEDGGHNFAGALWARGNSWITIAIPEMLELLAPSTLNDAFTTHLTTALTAQVAALVQTQDASGLWRTLLDQPVEEGSYVESSASAGFAGGMLMGIRMRLFPSTSSPTPDSTTPDVDGKVGGGGVSTQEITTSAIKAVKAVMQKIDSKGELQEVSFGTAMGRDLQHYKDIERTSMPYGQAMGVMMLGEVLRLFI